MKYPIGTELVHFKSGYSVHVVAHVDGRYGVVGEGGEEQPSISEATVDAHYMERAAFDRAVQAAHDHVWQPVEGARGRYACGCGATGYRAVNGPLRGRVVAHKVPRKHRPAGEQGTAVGRGAMHELGHTRHGKRGPGSY